MEFFNTKERLGEYWRLVQELWLRLYGLHAPTVAAINVSSQSVTTVPLKLIMDDGCVFFYN